MNESLEAQQEANKANTEYEEKWKKYEENPDLAKQNMKKANETFTSKKSPEELDKFQKVLEEVENLKLIPENKDKHSDELFKIAEKIVEEREWKENQQNSEEEIQIPESAEPITTKTTEKVWNILTSPKEVKVEKSKDKIDKNLLFTPIKPIIDWLEANWYIQNNNEINKNLVEGKVIKKTLFESVESNKELKENLWNYFEQKETMTPNTFEKSKFWTDIEKSNLKITTIWWLELLMAENYISIPNKQTWKNNIEEDISRTMDISLNKIIKVNSKDFRQANWELIKKIQDSWDIQTKYENLKELYKLDLKSDSKFFSKNDKLRKKKIETKIEKLDKQYKDFWVTIDIKSQNKQMKVREEILKLKEQLEELNIEKPTKQWDAKTWWSEIDVIDNDSSEIISENS